MKTVKSDLVLLFSLMLFSCSSCYFEPLWYVVPDYDTLRALDADNVPSVPSMTEEEINALPVHKYKVAGPQK